MRLLDNYDLFIFDWDHTLTDSTPFITLLEILGKNKRIRNDAALRKKYEPRNYAKRLKISETWSKTYALFDDVYSVIFHPRMKKDAVALLHLLKKRHKKVAIFSNSKTYRLLKETRELGVSRYFDFVLTAQSIKSYKPNPAGLLLIVERLKATRKRTIYVGDMASDVLTAKFAGVGSCAVADGVDGYERLKDSSPTYSFRDMSELLRAIK